jgi:membrane-associated phospholipid phosphatase
VRLVTDATFRLAGLVAGTLGFLFVAALGASEWTTGVDRAALDALAYLHRGPLDPLMIATTDLGNANVLGYLTILAAGAVWLRGSTRAALFLALGYVVSGSASDVLKAAIARPRPPFVYQIAELPTQTDRAIWAALAVVVALALWRSRWRWPAVAGAVFLVLSIWFDTGSIATLGLDSFPSGHALRSMVLALSIFAVGLFRPVRPAIIALGTAVLVVGVSRVYLGHHHPSDVVAGWFAGAALVAALSLLPTFTSMTIRPEPDEEHGRSPNRA